MCGIVGYTGSRAAMPIILEGLKRLEYRGYDSAGITTVSGTSAHSIKSAGKLRELERLLAKQHLPGSSGIGHTRWATHGKPTTENAHPHHSGSIALVHNGIIENYQQLKKSLQEKGYVFTSQTDTEVITHLVHSYYQGDLVKATEYAIQQLHGAYSLLVADSNTPGTLVCVKHQSPLVLGLGADENFIASDIPAILSQTREFIFLEDGDIAVVTPKKYHILAAGQEVDRLVKTICWSPSAAEKDGYKHFMLKEIHEQPRAVRDTLRGKFIEGKVVLSDLQLQLSEISDIRRITLVACGTSWHAAMVGKYYLEKYSRIPTEVDIASEYRYRHKIIDRHTLVIPVSQSGETADTLAALKEAKIMGAKVLSICNVLDSSIPRESHGVLYTSAGPEIGVASTKAFTTQLAALYLMALYLAQERSQLTTEQIAGKVVDLEAIPAAMESVLQDGERYARFAERYHNYSDFLFLGRSYNFPIALEGALKLKEISYIHAEGYASGEMKHGPIALIDENMPVVVIATPSEVHEKIVANMEEVLARRGRVIAISTDTTATEAVADTFIVPEVPEELSPLVNAIPMQFIAYYISDFKGCDVDQPRNLAKSVTVE
ncbi:glutamine--fructose-6-phosphate transaminase (isomerizing) [Desulfurispira natronophila]|uniref:Glutamine--fructose-6-phosphate aminotransferase [isomerizing] n=1 Tax=Desulfurispira natronophila TaxID=682562 RepID=A0A7W8DGS5_9BACT|nr:glutamine--fructose-6-phosphate transaminase (isomerizing) [Desulfurispira natronophila]MBB5021720.1 glucosamine--fructose-6-phosphate aminotransferase (isomerizing) [Desulfurispira natronophila]